MLPNAPRKFGQYLGNSMSVRVCKIDECGKNVVARGWCESHYCRWKRYGDPLSGSTYHGEPSAFLDEAVRSNTDECILWPYSVDGHGYGQITIERKGERAHRVVLERHLGRPIEAGKVAAHAPGACHNRACVNPRHLREATPSENQQDRVTDLTSNRGDQAANAKLTQAQVLAIRKDLRPPSQIAKDYPVETKAISLIKQGKRWSWLQSGPVSTPPSAASRNGVVR